MPKLEQDEILLSQVLSDYQQLNVVSNLVRSLLNILIEIYLLIKKKIR